MEKNVEERKIIASQQYTLKNGIEGGCMTKVKLAWENGFDASYKTFQFTLEDMEKCFKESKLRNDDDQPKFKTFKGYLKTLKRCAK